MMKTDILTIQTCHNHAMTGYCIMKNIFNCGPIKVFVKELCGLLFF